MLANVTGLLDESLTGVTAIKVAEKYNKPCLLLRKSKDNENIYAGSGRNINDSPVEDLKNFLEGTNSFEWVQGHKNAFGCAIKKDNIPLAISKINEILIDVDFSHCYKVDFIVDINDLDIRLIKEIDELKYFYGQGIDETRLVIKDVEFNKNNINIKGKNNDTWEYIFNDEITFIKFKCQDDDIVLKWLNDWENDEENIIVDVIGKCGFNNYNGILKPQVIVDTYERVR
jgi:single-stranded-DNA-specific exonuclease